MKMNGITFLPFIFISEFLEHKNFKRQRIKTKLELFPNFLLR